MGHVDWAEQNAAAEAVALGRNQILPLIARTPTMEEQAARGRGRLMLAAVALGLVALFVGGAGRDAGDLPRDVLILVGLAAGVVLLLWLLGRNRSKDLSAAAAATADPARQISVEVAEEALTVRRPGAVHRIAYPELGLAFCAWSNRGVSQFLGIDIETPLGRLRLEDGRFINGKAAAAAICRLMDERWILPPVVLPCAPP